MIFDGNDLPNGVAGWEYWREEEIETFTREDKSYINFSTYTEDGSDDLVISLTAADSVSVTQLTLEDAQALGRWLLWVTSKKLRER